MSSLAPGREALPTERRQSSFPRNREPMIFWASACAGATDSCGPDSELFLPGVAQGHGPVEAAVAVAHEVAVPLELEALLGLCAGERRLELRLDRRH